MARETLHSIAFGGLPDRPDFGAPEIITADRVNVGDVIEHAMGRWSKPATVIHVESFPIRELLGERLYVRIWIDNSKAAVFCPAETKYARYPQKES